jgi:hypothetical protein
MVKQLRRRQERKREMEISLNALISYLLCSVDMNQPQSCFIGRVVIVSTIYQRIIVNMTLENDVFDCRGGRESVLRQALALFDYLKEKNQRTSQSTRRVN